MVAEFIGTFALIFVGVGSIAVYIYMGQPVNLVAVALAHGLIIAAMASATMAISGGQLNPAVSISLMIVGKQSVVRGVSLIIAQILGALSAATLLLLALPGDVNGMIAAGTPALANGMTVLGGVIIEVVLTFILVFVIFGTAVDNRVPRLAGLLIGLTVTFAALMGGPFTGAALNPARHLGPAVIAGQLDLLWLYWVGPVLGGILAAIVFQKVIAKE